MCKKKYILFLAHKDPTYNETWRSFEQEHKTVCLEF